MTAVPAAGSPPHARRRPPLLGPRVVLVVVGVASTLAWGLFLAAETRTLWGGDPRGFLRLGLERQHAPVLAEVPRSTSRGYDGQYYAELAIDPFLTQPETAGHLDTPSYRARRIGTPLAAYLAGLGNPRAAIAAYLVLCWVLGIAGVWLAAAWLRSQGASSLWALWISVGAGLAASLLRVTPDALAVSLLLAALWAHRADRWRLCIVLLVAATLTRETSLLAALAITAVELRRQRVPRALTATLLPAGVLAAWQGYLLIRFGLGHSSGTGNFALPLTWLPLKMSQLGEPSSPRWLEIAGLAAIVATLLLPVLLFRELKRADAALLTVFLFSVAAWFLGYAVTSDAWACSRVLLAIPVIGLVAAESGGAGRQRAVLRSAAIVWAIVGVVMLHVEWRTALEGRPLRLALQEGTRPTPRPTAIPSSDSSDAPSTVFVLGAAHTQGRSGRWQTDLRLENRTLASVTASLTAFSSEPGQRPRRGTVRVRPRETRLIPDVIDTVCRFYGAVGLRVSTDRPGLTVDSRTYVDGGVASVPAWLPATPLVMSGRPAAPVVLRGLAEREDGDPRTNLCLMNASDSVARVEIAVTSPTGGHGGMALELSPWQFVQVFRLFHSCGLPRAANAEAVVAVSPPGVRLLAEATVVSDRPPSVAVVRP